MAVSAERSSDFVQSLDRGLAVIRAFSVEKPRLTLSDVARETGLTRAAARRFLLTLQELGYVGSDGRQFFLRPRVLELGFAYLSSATVTTWKTCVKTMRYPALLLRRLQTFTKVASMDMEEWESFSQMSS